MIANNKDEGDGNEESDTEELAEAEEEEESDLDLAWKMLDLARAISEKHSRETMDNPRTIQIPNFKLEKQSNNQEQSRFQNNPEQLKKQTMKFKQTTIKFKQTTNNNPENTETIIKQQKPSTKI